MSWLWFLPLGVVFMAVGAVVDRKLGQRSGYTAVPTESVDV